MPVLTPNFGGFLGLIVDLGQYTPLGSHTEDTAGAAAATLTEPRPAKATGVLLSCVDAGILFTLDGTDPTVTPGFPIPKDLLPLYIPIPSNVTFTFVREAAVDASVRYQWVLVGG